MAQLNNIQLSCSEIIEESGIHATSGFFEPIRMIFLKIHPMTLSHRMNTSINNFLEYNFTKICMKIHPMTLSHRMNTSINNFLEYNFTKIC
ncbi:MAG: hypothetical protein HW421_2308 [Ignavibacteria bacterium]|nr:hypothetical protein [Ignavibacteria bacterium]